MRSLKDLADQLETLVDQNSSQLSTDVRQQFELKIAELKKESDVADEKRTRELTQDALNIFSNLLTIATNVLALVAMLK